MNNQYAREAGVLLHITSLPSRFGIGDFGPDAYKFADFLKENNQQYWQLLPLTITETAQGFSPYSASSCMGGNTLLISPEQLVKDKLLDVDSLKEYAIPNKSKVDFHESVRIKTELFNKAHQNFLDQKNNPLQKEFEMFCREESYWLDDFALYMNIKHTHKSIPWYDWPDPYKFRDDKTLKKFTEDNHNLLLKEKWLQFIFFKQWKALRQYCNEKGIKIFGDLPFYISYDSVDVWSNGEIFSLDRNGDMLGMAGVPPDYFNADGQLWGMPVFKWDVLKKSNYDWWIKRIRKNIELYDLLRFDHFRAFAAFWDVPKGEKTAVKGVWKAGPGKPFFKVLKKEFKEMPFVAEDLGDIDELVHELRDDFSLPGMKVLQFAFSNDIAKSDHIPHNYANNFIAYTGTHDNNTSRGWLRENKDKSILKNLKLYLGKPFSEKNIHINLINLAYASVARIAIIPMQDILGLDEKSRINTPASTTNNWQWRMKGSDFKNIEIDLKGLTEFYNRKAEDKTIK